MKEAKMDRRGFHPKSILFRCINAGVFADTDFETVKRLRLLNLMMLLGSVMIGWFTYLNYSLGFIHLVAVDLLLIGTAMLAWILHFFRGYKLSRFLLFVMFPLQFLYYPVYIGDIGTEYYQLMFIIIAFYCFSNRYILYLLTAYLTALFIYAKYSLKTGQFPEEYRVLESFHYFPSVIASASFIVLAISTFKINTNMHRKRMTDAESDLRAKLAETARQVDLNDSLFKELNHRVKNNLQLISGLFTMQTYENPNPAIQKAVAIARQRIDIIANLHQQLYRSSTSTTPDIGEYLRGIVAYTQQQLSSEYGGNVSISLNAFSQPLSVDKCIDIGLLVNELFALIVRSQAKTSNTCQIQADFHVDGHTFTVSVYSNNGAVPFEKMEYALFSHRLIQMLTEKYNGSVIWGKSLSDPTIISLNIETSL